MRIKRVRESYRGVGMKQTELAARAGISRGRLANWEVGKSDPRNMSIVNRIASILEVPVEVLRDGAVVREDPTLPRTRSIPTGRLKVYGALSAGDGNASEGDESFIDVPIELAREDYGAMMIEGDSMMPFLYPGDTAIFQDFRREKVGHVVAACIEDHKWVAKLCAFDGKQFVLRSLNPQYPDIIEDFRIQGFLVGLIHEDGLDRIVHTNPHGIKPPPAITL